MEKLVQELCFWIINKASSLSSAQTSVSYIFEIWKNLGAATVSKCYLKDLCTQTEISLRQFKKRFTRHNFEFHRVDLQCHSTHSFRRSFTIFRFTTVHGKNHAFVFRIQF